MAFGLFVTQLQWSSSQSATHLSVLKISIVDSYINFQSCAPFTFIYHDTFCRKVVNEWKLILFPLSLPSCLFNSGYFRTWRQLSSTPIAACWRTSRSLFLFLWTRYQTWSFPHISLFPGAQVRLRLSRNILVTTASVAFRTSESFHFWTKQQLVTIQLYNWRSD